MPCSFKWHRRTWLTESKYQRELLEVVLIGFDSVTSGKQPEETKQAANNGHLKQSIEEDDDDDDDDDEEDQVVNFGTKQREGLESRETDLAAIALTANKMDVDDTDSEITISSDDDD